MATITSVAVIGVALLTTVFVVHLGLIVIMTVEAVEHRAVGRVGVTGGAIIPLIVVCPAEDREKLCVMINELPFETGRMTIVAGGAGVCVARHIAVDTICFGAAMTVETVENLAVIGHSVAIGAVRPFAGMCAGEYRKELTVVSGELSFLATGMTEVTVIAVVYISCHVAVCAISDRFLVAQQTVDRFAISGCGMAFLTAAPLSFVRTREYRKELNVVAGELTLLTVWMTKIAVFAVVSIPAHVSMRSIHGRLVVLMTGQAIYMLPDRRNSMAGSTGIPLILVATRKNRKVNRVVSDEVPFLPGRMTEITVAAVVSVAGDTVVGFIHLRSGMIMTNQTSKSLKAVGVSMAGGAVVPL